MNPTPLRSNLERSKVAMYFALTAAFVYLTSGVHGLVASAQLGEIAEGGLFGQMFRVSEAETIQLRVGLIAIALAIILVAYIVVYLMWFHRAYKNLNRLMGSTNSEPGWAVGAWFIPLAFFYWPFSIAREMAQNYGKIALGFPGQLRADTPHPKRMQQITLVWWLVWWTLHITGSVYAIDSDPKSIEEIADQTFRNAVQSLLLVLPCLLSAYHIFQLSKLETNVYAIWQSGEYDERREQWLERKQGGKPMGKEEQWYDANAGEADSGQASDDPFLKG